MMLAATQFELLNAGLALFIFAGLALLIPTCLVIAVLKLRDSVSFAPQPVEIPVKVKVVGGDLQIETATDDVGTD